MSLAGVEKRGFPVWVRRDEASVSYELSSGRSSAARAAGDGTGRGSSFRVVTTLVGVTDRDRTPGGGVVARSVMDNGTGTIRVCTWTGPGPSDLADDDRATVATGEAGVINT
mmetsp:Transcript_54297/g.119028  ORF Transcript_54297/g.119028 Transcript_54297/m.119028 type:complete len:112 (-) Transcript_54297:197-532(-)